MEATHKETCTDCGKPFMSKNFLAQHQESGRCSAIEAENPSSNLEVAGKASPNHENMDGDKTSAETSGESNAKTIAKTCSTKVASLTKRKTTKRGAKTSTPIQSTDAGENPQERTHRNPQEPTEKKPRTGVTCPVNKCEYMTKVLDELASHFSQHDVLKDNKLLATEIRSYKAKLEESERERAAVRRERQDISQLYIQKQADYDKLEAKIEFLRGVTNGGPIVKTEIEL